MLQLRINKQIPKYQNGHPEFKSVSERAMRR
jgi:hypothetical protein